MVKQAPKAKANAQDASKHTKAKPAAKPKTVVPTETAVATLGAMANPFRTLMRYRASEQCKKALTFCCTYLFLYTYQLLRRHLLRRRHLLFWVIHILISYQLSSSFESEKATPEERKDACDALTKYDTLVDDEERKRCLIV